MFPGKILHLPCSFIADSVGDPSGGHHTSCAKDS
jgi:hypothetical protein